jgi:hypothetical protein
MNDLVQTQAPRDRTSEAGISLIQTVLAAALLAALLLGVVRVVLSTTRHHAQTEAGAIALSVLRDKISEIQGLANQDMGQVLTTYSDHQFTVPAVPGVHTGLQPTPGNAFVGTVLCWNDETGATLPAGANPGDSARAGLPRDLNMDDDPNDTALFTADMKVVPMKIMLDFRDASGLRHLEVFYLASSQQ